jgi:hypothetical protein
VAVLLLAVIVGAGVPLVVMVRWSADPVVRIEAAVARDERRIRRLLAAGWRNEEILARHRSLQPHHVASVRSRFGGRWAPQAGGHMRARRSEERDPDDG